MKISELQLGDWLLCNGRFGQVSTIWNEERVSIRHETGIFNQMHNTDIKPIPLTGDMLRMNGFTDCETSDFDKEHGNWYWYLGEDGYIADDDLMINLMKNSFLVRDAYGSAYGLRYVHELQHALRLFGNDKEIIL